MSNFLYCLADSTLDADQQEKLLLGSSKAYGLEDCLPVKETSPSSMAFQDRHYGRWILSSIRPGDAVVFLKLGHFGEGCASRLRLLKVFFRKKAKVVVHQYLKHTALVLDGPAFEFFLFAVEGFRSVAPSKPRKKRNTSEWGKVYRISDIGQERLVWDNTQLRHVSEIARRWLLEDDKLGDIVREYHNLGIRDHTGKLFGMRIARNSKTGVSEDGAIRTFMRYANEFMQAGLNDDMPIEWNAVAKEIQRRISKKLSTVPAE